MMAQGALFDESLSCFEASEASAAENEIDYDEKPTPDGAPMLLTDAGVDTRRTRRRRFAKGPDRRKLLSETRRKCCFSGPRPFSYDPALDGFTIVMNVGQTAAQHIDFVNGLFKHGSWLDSATSQINIQVPMFSRQLGMFVLLNIDFDIDDGGNWAENHQILAFETHTDDDSETSQTITTLRVIQICYVLGALLKCVAFEGRWKYNTLRGHKAYSRLGAICSIAYRHSYGLLHLVLSVAWSGFYMVYDSECSKLVSQLKYVVHGEYNEFTPVFLTTLYEVHHTYLIYQNATVFFLIFSYVRFLQFTNFHPKIALLSRVIYKAAPALAFFMVMVLILTVGFAVIGMVIFPFKDFKNFGASFQSCGMIALGLYGNYDVLEKLKPTMAPIFFWIFTILVFIFVVNMLLAIINDVYVEVTENLDKEQKRKRRLEPKLAQFIETAKERAKAKKAASVETGGA